MIKHKLNSLFSNKLVDFAAYKNALGYVYYDSSRILWNFDTFCAQYFPGENVLVEKIGMKWLEKKDSENAAGHRNRVMVIREFAKYLHSIGENAYLIPITMTSKPKRYVPHIFTEAELSAFFKAADNFPEHKDARARHLVIPVFFRLLYCCGLRPAEARLLLTKNINLEQGIIKIVESKGHKDRLVAISEDLVDVMITYKNEVAKIFPQCPYFFPRYDGRAAYAKRWPFEMFWRCWNAAGSHSFSGQKPRTYDFRHTFATNCIYRWAKEGKDADAMLPYLSAYMGHTMPCDTAYYIHLVPDLFTKLAKLDISEYENLIPEVQYED